MDVEEAVVLAILLNKGSILNKSPDYISEKAEMVELEENPECLLDQEGFNTFRKWKSVWRKGEVNG